MQCFGADGVEISAHAISAPDHLPVQGRQFTNEEFFKMQNGLDFEDINGNEYEGFPRPLMQWNCRHVSFPIVIGISKPAYTEEQLKDFERNSKLKYDLTQRQRAMETKLRQLKTERIAASAAGDELEAKRIQRKINEQQTIYRRFSQKHDLLYDTRRASVEGYKRIAVKNTKSPLENNGESGIINYKLIDRAHNEHNSTNSGVYKIEKIEQNLLKTNIGKSTLEYIEKTNKYVTFNYDPNVRPDICGKISGREITIYPNNCKDFKDVCGTLIHETAHEQYGWKHTQEDEINCYLIELLHAKEHITTKDIQRIVDFVKQEYSYLPEGQLYGF